MNIIELAPLPKPVVTTSAFSTDSNSRAYYTADQMQAYAIAAIQAQASVVQQEPVMIYHGDCTIDCGEHGHHHVELLKMIPAGSRLYTRPAPQAKKARKASADFDLPAPNDSIDAAVQKGQS